TCGDAQPGGFGGPMNAGQMQPQPEQGGAPFGQMQQSEQGGTPAEEGESDGRQQPAEGEMPSFAEGEIPSFAEGETPEDFAGGRASGESRGFAGPEQDEAEEEETTVSNKVSLSELDSSVWIWLGISAAVVIAGLLMAFFYRRGRL
ncbi:MAG: hypothetical protein IKG67_12035, partial [Parasporobacterium sp.]|nr:hypothetical protein [Parasporobacterium sp.]